MSSTIYGNTTANGINIDDMVDDNRDIVYSIYDKYFARLVYTRDNVQDEPKPAIAAFNEDNAFFAIYAKVLPGNFDMYWDGWDTTELFKKELEVFAHDFRQYLSETRDEAVIEESNYGKISLTDKIKGDIIRIFMDDIEDEENCQKGFLVTKYVSEEYDSPMTFDDCVSIAKENGFMNGVFYIIAESPLEGKIYQYGNCYDCEPYVSEYGTTRGYA